MYQKKLDLEGPSSPKPKDESLHVRNPCHLLFLLINTFVIEHILICLPMDPSMMWHFHQVNKSWYNIVGNTMAWNVLGIVKIDNTSYHETIKAYKLPKHYLKTCLQFELESLKCLFKIDS
jgi:hypothetical protein